MVTTKTWHRNLACIPSCSPCPISIPFAGHARGEWAAIEQQQRRKRVRARASTDFSSGLCMLPRSFTSAAKAELSSHTSADNLVCRPSGLPCFRMTIAAQNIPLLTPLSGAATDEPAPLRPSSTNRLRLLESERGPLRPRSSHLELVRVLAFFGRSARLFENLHSLCHVLEHRQVEQGDGKRQRLID